MGSLIDIDTELFISAVKQHDCIWNYKIQDYSNKTMRNRAWESVYAQVINDFDKKTTMEKNVIAIELQNKWKTLRDGFTRYCRNRKKKSGSETCSMKEYTYYKELLFLKNLTEFGRKRTLNFERASSSCINIRTDENRIIKKSQRMRRREATEGLIAKNTKPLNDRLNRDSQPETIASYIPEDEDRLFLLSLLGDFKTIPGEYKLDAKGDIIEVIKKYRNISSDHSTCVMEYSTISNSQIQTESVKQESEDISDRYKLFQDYPV